MMPSALKLNKQISTSYFWFPQRIRNMDNSNPQRSSTSSSFTSFSSLNGLFFFFPTPHPLSFTVTSAFHSPSEEPLPLTLSPHGFHGADGTRPWSWGGYGTLGLGTWPKSVQWGSIQRSYWNKRGRESLPLAEAELCGYDLELLPIIPPPEYIA